MPGADAVPATAVLDASVAVRWVVPEHGSEQAAALLARPIAWIAPRLMLTETAAALRRKVVAGALRADLAAQALDVLIRATADGTVRLADDEAEREGAALVTADRRLDELARRRGVASELVPCA